ncbi:MAG: restriction endonuclease subunit S [Candidatus Pristimantibacillus sp.]
MRVKLDEVVDRITGNVDRFNTDLVYYCGGEHYESSSIAIYYPGLLESEKGRTLGFKFRFPFTAGDVLFMSRNPHLRKAGKVMFDGICSDTSYILRTKDNNVLLQDFLPLVIQNDNFWDFFEANKSGSVNYLLNWKEMQNYEFELPDIQKQRKIAELAWSIEETRVKYRKLLLKTDELVKAQFIEMFGVPGTDEKGWGLTTLGECCVLNPRRPKDMNVDSDYSFVAMPSVSGKGIIDTSIHRPYAEINKGFTYFAENDVLFAKITPCMENGKGGVAIGLQNGAGFGSTEFHVLRPISGKSNPYWIYVITMFSKFRRDAEKVMTGTGGQRRVPILYLDEYLIALPPLPLQEQFASLVQQSYKSKFELERTLSDLDALYKRIISENFI